MFAVIRFIAIWVLAGCFVGAELGFCAALAFTVYSVIAAIETVKEIELLKQDLKKE